MGPGAFFQDVGGASQTRTPRPDDEHVAVDRGRQFELLFHLAISSVQINTISLMPAQAATSMATMIAAVPTLRTSFEAA